MNTFKITSIPISLQYHKKKMATFSAWDYVVFVIMLIISASIGVYYRFTGGRQKTVSVSSI